MGVVEVVRCEGVGDGGDRGGGGRDCGGSGVLRV